MNELIESEFRETPLTQREMMLRDLFVDEYLIDYDAEDAALRVGFDRAFAFEFAREFLCEGYTQRKIIEGEQKELQPDATDKLKNRVIKMIIKEANNKYNKSTNRVAAIAQLVKVLRLEPPTQIEGTIKGGVMIVPEMTNYNDWGKSAEFSQQELQKSVRD